MNRAQPGALLVDYGGVLTSSVVDSFTRFCEKEGIDADLFGRILMDTAGLPGSPFARVETGALDQEAFDREVAALLTEACGRPVNETGLKDRLFAAIRPDAVMRRAVRTARATGIRTALVSNSWGGSGYPREEFDALLDAVVISGEIGLRKPDAAMYLFAADQTDVPPESCVFVDDLRINVEEAEAVGMRGILHRDAAETVVRLEEIFGLDLRTGIEG